MLCGLFNCPAADNTVPVVCVWRYILVERTSAHMWTLIHHPPMHKHRCSTTVLHQLGVWRCSWCWRIRVRIFISGGLHLSVKMKQVRRDLHAALSSVQHYNKTTSPWCTCMYSIMLILLDIDHKYTDWMELHGNISNECILLHTVKSKSYMCASCWPLARWCTKNAKLPLWDCRTCTFQEGIVGI